MVSVKEVTDEQLRRSLAQAEAALDDGQYAACVEHSVDAYSQLIAQRPDMIIAGPIRRGAVGGVAQGGPRPWPSDHGVRFSMQEGQPPTLTIDKERFTLSEAATYFEYTLDLVLRAQRHPPAGAGHG